MNNIRRQTTSQPLLVEKVDDTPETTVRERTVYLMGAISDTEGSMFVEIIIIQR